MRTALLLAAVLAIGATASAQAAGLSVQTAKRLAVRLGEKQERTQGVVAYHLGRAHRTGANSVSFPYDARTKNQTYCVSVLAVKARQHGRTLRITATIGHQSCIKIPADALGVEHATRVAQRAMHRHNRATKRSLANVERSLGSCSRLRVPHSRRAAVRAIADVARTDALVAPNGEALNSFVGRLGAVQTTNSRIENGVAAWTDYVQVLNSLPPVPRPCNTLKRWSRRHWAAADSPFDLSSYRQLGRRATADQRAIAKTARYLRSVGVFPDAVVAFTPDGLLLRLRPKS